MGHAHLVYNLLRVPGEQIESELILPNGRLLELQPKLCVHGGTDGKLMPITVLTLPVSPFSFEVKQLLLTENTVTYNQYTHALALIPSKQ